MSSRKELKEQRRREREEAERAEARAERRRRRLLVGSIATGAILVAALLVVAWPGGGAEGEEVFAAKPEGLEQRLADAGLETGQDHFHPLVRVVARGKQIPIPDDIGTPLAGGVHIPVHRHPGDEMLHAEGLDEGKFSLGQFMQVWGVPFSEGRLGPYEADEQRKVTVLVKDKGAAAFRESREFENLQLRDGQEVYVVYGTPEESPVNL